MIFLKACIVVEDAKKNQWTNNNHHRPYSPQAFGLVMVVKAQALLITLMMALFYPNVPLSIINYIILHFYAFTAVTNQNVFRVKLPMH